MVRRFLSRPLIQRSGQFSLRYVLVVPFVMLVLAVMLVGWMSVWNGQTAVNEVTRQLRNEVTVRVQQNLRTYLKTPHVVNQINADAIRLGHLDVADTTGLGRHFWRQIQLFDPVISIALGRPSGDFIGVGRPGNDVFPALRLGLAGQETGGRFYSFALDSEGDREGDPAIGSVYDPRSRPWYEKATQAGKATWSEIYTDFADPRLVITASQPIYDADGNLQAVLATDLLLSQINNFLRTTKIGRNGQTFIVEASGAL
ncbi:MAG TPA: cache domain-containing protein, partial [Chroococcidiopsis sp.]